MAMLPSEEWDRPVFFQLVKRRESLVPFSQNLLRPL
jgi:hypothetical protein